jgi:5-formaminoimidazole-4-carboxamide-1-beta-D-ribofuranosyl 5'-monophosphate synthetase
MMMLDDVFARLKIDLETHKSRVLSISLNASHAPLPILEKARDNGFKMGN